MVKFKYLGLTNMEKDIFQAIVCEVFVISYSGNHLGSHLGFSFLMYFRGKIELNMDLLIPNLLKMTYYT